MLQTNRKPSGPPSDTPAIPALSGHAVLVSGLALGSSAYPVIEQACAASGVSCRPLDEARRTRLPNGERGCLIVALLPQGERRVPPDVSEAVELSFPGVPILLMCQEQLVRPSISVEDGRVILIGQPFTEDKLALHFRSIVEKLPPAQPIQPILQKPAPASASGPRPGISRARGEDLRKAPPRPTRPKSHSGSNWIVFSVIALCTLTALGLYFFVFSNSSETQFAKRPPNDADSKPANITSVKEPESPVEKPAPPPPPNQLTLDIGSAESIELRRVQAGSFLMGSPATEHGRSDEEPLPKETKIERSFYLARYEISQSQYAAVMGVNPSQNKDPRQPVDTVSYLDAMEFCEKLTAKTNHAVRLPTEAEWEYACRAGTTTPFYFGETLSVDQANVDWPDAGAERRRESVASGSYAANAWGFHDMHGNVWEWCQSNSDKNQLQILRGGSWMNTARQARSAARQAYQPGGRNSDYGFRIAVDLPETASPVTTAPASFKKSDPNPTKK